ncbi:MAG: COX15/CtaA family protein [Proteobacteria bacterium]|nr:COX15/CtaA family protein [Pseudomonadota bacterium]
MISLSTRTAPREPWVGVWLLVIALLVLAMVLVGGATRLTESGLSITEWKPISGALPPMNAADWERAFAQYRETTQYQMLNRGMTLAEFQNIFWWEWSHRLLGRVIGLVFALPLVVFWIQRRLRGRLAPVLVLFALGGLQGFVGWLMVQSGLSGRTEVNPAWLAAHLAVAFTIMAFALWLALDAFGWPRTQSKLGAPRWAPAALMALIFVQVMLGALLAGARGGGAYPDWPTIGHEWIPSGAFSLEPFARNFIDNHATQQLMHRTTGYLVALCVVAIAVLALRRGSGAARVAGIAVGVLALSQAGLGIATILLFDPLALALAHQAGAALLWGGATVLLRSASGNIQPHMQVSRNEAKNAVA